MVSEKIPKREKPRVDVRDIGAANTSPIDGGTVNTEAAEDDQRASENTINALKEFALRMPFISDEERLTTRKIYPAQRKRDRERTLEHKARLAVKLDEMRERFMYVIEGWASDINRYDWLENHTGIPAARWQNVMLEKQLPTLEMLLVVCKYNPEYTNWLMHGGPLDSILIGQQYPDKELWDRYKAYREWVRKKRMARKAAK